MNENNVPKLCGYIESQLREPCRNPDEGNGFCAHHNQPMFSVCVGCGGQATHLCAEHITSPLCGTCVDHVRDDGTAWHGPQGQADPAPPPFEPSGAEKPDTATLREQLEEAALLSMRESRRDMLSEQDTARKVIADLGVNLLVPMLTGLVRQQAQQQGAPG